MMMQVSCPSCRGALTAPAEMAGGLVRCPRCNCQMKLPAMPGTTPPATPLATKASATPSPPPVAKRYRSEDMLPPSATSAAPPATSTATARPRVPRSEPAAALPADPSTDTLTTDGEVTARFIAKREMVADPATLTGKLPTLHLADSIEKPRALAASASLRGPLLGVALVFSVVASAALLLWEPGETRTMRPDKYYAWQQLEEVYFGDGAPLRPYQQLLRQAQQAHHRGDRAKEAALLRQVLDMLHAERPNPNFGVTGYQTSAPPNDWDLEEKVTLLLREE